MKTKMIKSFSLVLTLIMLLSAIPFTASAAEPIALTEANVTVWPTASGEIYFGQKVSEGITLTGGAVVYEGESVPGHFEFLDPDARPSLGVASLKFVPDDTQNYQGFEVEYAWDVMFTINKTTPVLVDENNPPVATAVEAGAKLSTSTLTGGQIYNPYYPEEETALAGTWKWAKGSTIVNESGYYEARITVTNYNRITTQVYVRIAGEIPETTITEAPTVPADLKYDGVTTWGDIPLEGGKAELKVEGTAVEGTFAVTDYWKTRTVNVGSYEIDVVFTPADPEAALPYSLKIPVTVNKAPVKFVDSEGEEIVPEITIEYTNAKIGQYNFRYYLKPYTNLTDSDGVSFNFAGLEGENDYITVGTKKYKINASAQNQNYEKSVLEFILTVTPKPLDITVSYVNNQIVISRTTTDRINGSFEIYVDGVKLADGVKIEGAQSSAKYGWTPKTSGTHTVKAVYVPAENDTVSIEPAETQVQMNLTRALGLPEGSGYIAKVNGSSNFTSVACGDTVSLSCTFEDFECWIITGADGNPVDLGTVMTEKTVTDANGGVTFVTEEGDLSCANIIFAMPDEDITVTYKLKEADTGNDPVDGEKDFFAQVKAFFENLFNGETNCPVLKWIINVFNVIVNFFTGLFVK